MTSKQIQQTLDNIRYLLTEAEDTAGDETPSVASKNQQQQQFRNSAYEKGWINFGVIGPAPAIEHMKKVWADYRSEHPGLWGDQESEEGSAESGD